jgi:hypothetical protein
LLSEVDKQTGSNAMSTVRLSTTLGIADLKRAIKLCRSDIKSQYSSGSSSQKDALSRIGKLDKIIKVSENATTLDGGLVLITSS